MSIIIQNNTLKRRLEVSEEESNKKSKTETEAFPIFDLLRDMQLEVISKLPFREQYSLYRNRIFKITDSEMVILAMKKDRSKINKIQTIFFMSIKDNLFGLFTAICNVGNINSNTPQIDKYRLIVNNVFNKLGNGGRERTIQSAISHGSSDILKSLIKSHWFINIFKKNLGLAMSSQNEEIEITTVAYLLTKIANKKS